MRQRILTLELLLFLAAFSANGQNWTTDTLNWGNKLLTIKLPDDFKLITDNYTEGVILHYIFADTSIVTIFHGYNAILTPYRHAEFDTLSVNSNISSGTIGRTEKLWKVVKKSASFMYWYNLVNPEQEENFERILNSIELKTKRSGG